MIQRKEVLEWFEGYFFSRFEVKIKLKYNKSKTELNLFIKENRLLSFTLNKNKLNFNKKNCDYWFFKKEDLEFISKKDIPTPGVEKIKYPLVELNKRYAKLNYDLVSFVFWNLNRIEEKNDKKKDKHYRCLGVNSYAFRNNYLYRPVVDEWMIIIKKLILKYEPKVKFKESKFTLEPTHDIDIAFKYLQLNYYQIFRKFFSVLIKKKSLKRAFKILIKIIRIKRGQINLDPFNTFEKLMSISESLNTKSIFYLQTNISNPLYDTKRDIRNIYYTEILKEIIKRDHILGIHPSYEAFKNRNLILKEKNKLEKLLIDHKINKKIIHSRMHYLRWDHQKSITSLEKTGIKFDSTLGYPDTGGFKSGTCFSYKPFNCSTNRISNIIIKPLIIMDDTLFSKSYLSLNSKKAKNLAIKLKKECKNVGGTFNILWHNNNFNNSIFWYIYKLILTT